jgi:hypothetical protein
MKRLKKDGQGKNPKYVAYVGFLDKQPISL